MTKYCLALIVILLLAAGTLAFAQPGPPPGPPQGPPGGMTPQGPMPQGPPGGMTPQGPMPQGPMMQGPMPQGPMMQGPMMQGPGGGMRGPGGRMGQRPGAGGGGLGGLLALLCLAGWVLFLVVAWRLMRAQERIAQATERLADKLPTEKPD